MWNRKKDDLYGEVAQHWSASHAAGLSGKSLIMSGLETLDPQALGKLIVGLGNSLSPSLKEEPRKNSCVNFLEVPEKIKKAKPARRSKRASRVPCLAEAVTLLHR